MALLRKQIPKHTATRKTLSLAFLASILLIYTVLYFSAKEIALFWSVTALTVQSRALFLAGFVASFTLFRSSSLRRLKVFIHEVKHGVLIILTGGRLTKFHAGSFYGSVEYAMTKRGLRLEPFIVLAPYYLPLFSAPALVACLLLEAEYAAYLLAALGIGLGFDLASNYEEFHPRQSDLKSIRGGKLFLFPFVLGFNALWTSLCLLWVIAGVDGFSHLGFRLYQAILQLFDHALELLSAS